ncbi:hypothetical protein [Microbacterium sp. WCS2018Hpa-9]|uniref:hypothetical protein n=1 Tax=Microbacterium sp. WCS2018Hpa-9 TaxID=3073635 RepID=UPI00288BD042|nr:hypothetical protein [Microbacterium sp. WCS2018Hpa-9]
MSGDSRDPQIPSEEAVNPPPPRAEARVPDGVIPPPPAETPIPDGLIPPPPPETPIPEGLIPAAPVIPPPPAESAIPDAVIPPPPPEAMLPSTRRSRPKPAILTGDQPAPVADDWAQPSVAPEAPTSGGYGVFSVVIFVFLIVLLGAAIAGAIYLATSVPFALGAGEPGAIAGALWRA